MTTSVHENIDYLFAQIVYCIRFINATNNNNHEHLSRWRIKTETGDLRND